MTVVSPVTFTILTPTKLGEESPVFTSRVNIFSIMHLDPPWV